MGSSSQIVRRISRTLANGPDWADASAGFLDRPADARALVLESSSRDARWGRLSYLAAEPVAELVAPGGGRTQPAAAVLTRLRDAIRSTRLDDRDRPVENRFIGGWAGHLGYEFGASLEGVPPAACDDIPLPAMRWALYDAVACYDHAADEWGLSALVLDDEAAAARRLDALETRLRARRDPSARREYMAGLPAVCSRPASWRPGADVRCSLTRADFERAVARAKDYIAAGDIYQVNLAQRFTWNSEPGPDGPGRLFAALRAGHAARFAALLAWRDPAGQVQALCSASPELFLAVHDGQVVTRPIKGTRRRRPGESDRHAIAELLASPKDAAELAMIIDLERNDLGRVCRYGSVRVTEPRVIESLAHVHHTAATVEGRLADGSDLVDLLAATFPGGSITGAPKVRAMQIVAELEPTVRSAYTGAIGYLGADGSAMLNIAIRTAVVAGGRVHLHVGGGIVADSQPADEYEETLDKAEGLAQAIEFAIAPPG